MCFLHLDLGVSQWVSLLFWMLISTERVSIPQGNEQLIAAQLYDFEQHDIFLEHAHTKIRFKLHIQ